MLRQFRLSETRVDFIKTAEHIKILSLCDKPIILVFHHQGLLCSSDGFTPNAGAEYKGGGNDFRQTCGYISEMIIDRGIFTIEDKYKAVCTLLLVPLSMVSSNPEPHFQV